MSDLLPLFPLPNVVLFPNVFLPLHIFEARYRDMVADAIASDRLIGMVLLRQGWEEDYGAQPPVYAIGTSGLITHVEQLADGRYNIVLRGLERFRIVEEDHGRTYRRGLVEPLAERPTDSDDRIVIRRQRAKLEEMLAKPGDVKGADPRIPSAMADEDLVNALAQYLDLEPIEKQALLEHHSLRARAESLVDLLEMKTIMARTPGMPNVAN
jgi:Lon protease-like protein